MSDRSRLGPWVEDGPITMVRRDAEGRPRMTVVTVDGGVDYLISVRWVEGSASWRLSGTARGTRAEAMRAADDLAFRVGIAVVGDTSAWPWERDGFGAQITVFKAGGLACRITVAIGWAVSWAVVSADGKPMVHGFAGDSAAAQREARAWATWRGYAPQVQEPPQSGEEG